MFHLVKKYSNRKLYDIHQKRFIRQEELADMVIRGDEVRVEDSDAGIDITALEVSKALLKVTSRGKVVLDLLNEIDNGRFSGQKKVPVSAESIADSVGENEVPYIPAEIRLLDKGLDYLRACSEILQKEPVYNRSLHNEFCELLAGFTRKLGRLKKKHNLQ
jgi:hypothetical protein